MKIYKYPLPYIEHVTQILYLPLGSKPLTVQLQDGMPTLWALVDPDAKATEHRFVALFTGEEIDQNIEDYLGTCNSDGTVWHFFTVKQG